jgi:hypothetical protein
MTKYQCIGHDEHGNPMTMTIHADSILDAYSSFDKYGWAVDFLTFENDSSPSCKKMGSDDEAGDEGGHPQFGDA